VESDASVTLMQQFTADETEKGGGRVRDRMKMVPSVANKEQAVSAIQ
jgi:hypothetical protein